MPVGILSGHICGAPPGATHGALGTIKHAVLELPLSENKVSTSKRTFDHLAQVAQGFALAFIFLCQAVDVARVFGG